MPRHVGGGIKVVRADEGLELVVEVHAGPYERSGGVREARRVGVMRMRVLEVGADGEAVEVVGEGGGGDAVVVEGAEE
ncbi:hypothetical protein QYF36_014155 [Acer negundo]|nr:hypothetical protein QYF36_014155 [Acer negundo]